MAERYRSWAVRAFAVLVAAGCAPGSDGDSDMGPPADGDAEVEADVEVDVDGDGDGDAADDRGEISGCGNGAVEDTEECDDGNARDGDGCGAACRIEPGWVCPEPARPCSAAACGDALIAGGEQCDDGNSSPGDGCSSACRLEDGWACDAPGTPCRRTTCGDGVVEGTEQCEDGNHDLGDGCDPFCRREPRCTDGDCTSVCGDGVRVPGEQCDDANVRDGDGCSASCTLEEGYVCTDVVEAEPERAAIPIVFRDFRGRDLPGGHPDFEYNVVDDRGMVAERLGSGGKPVYAAGGGSTPTTNGASWFDMWYRDEATYNRVIVDRLVLDRTDPGTFVFDSDDFFPLDGRGFVAEGAEAPRTGGHNFHFTSELRYWFTFEGGEELTFRGDDDVWVFVNGHLAVDIGGVHGAESAGVTLGPAEASSFGLRPGGTYEAAVFQAERHTTQSSYRLTLRGFRAARSECAWGRCGDGIVEPAFGEECDDGNRIPGDGCDANCRIEIW